MTRGVRAMRAAASLAVVCACSGVAAGCAWQPYVVTRGIRHVLGNHARMHPIVPLTVSLKPYRVLEIAPLENLLGVAIPATTERYLDDRVVDGLRLLPTAPEIVVLRGGPAPVAQPNSAAGPRTLHVEGFIDDLDAGSLPLRIAELGFNHVAVTVRIRLRDKATSEVIGAASFTAQDDRATASANVAINNLAKQIRAYVESGYAQ